MGCLFIVGFVEYVETTDHGGVKWRLVEGGVGRRSVPQLSRTTERLRRMTE